MRLLSFLAPSSLRISLSDCVRVLAVSPMLQWVGPLAWKTDLTCDVGQPILAEAAFQGGFACDHRNGSCLAMLRLRSQQRPTERRLQPGLAAPRLPQPLVMVSGSRAPMVERTGAVSGSTETFLSPWSSIRQT